MGLLDRMYNNAETRDGITTKKIYSVPREKLRVVPGFNVRDIDQNHVASLAEMYRKGKDLPPLVVCVAEDGMIDIVDGEHRYWASGMAEMKRLPVLEFEGTEEEKIALAISSSQGRQLTPVQRALAYLRLHKRGWTDKEIAEEVTRSEGDVANHLLLAKCGTEVHEAVKAKEVSATAIIDLARKHTPAKVWGLLEPHLTKARAEAAAAEPAEPEASEAPAAAEATSTEKPAAKAKGKAAVKKKPAAKKKVKVTGSQLSFSKADAMRLAELATTIEWVGTSGPSEDLKAMGKHGDDESFTLRMPSGAAKEFFALRRKYLGENWETTK